MMNRRSISTSLAAALMLGLVIGGVGIYFAAPQTIVKTQTHFQTITATNTVTRTITQVQPSGEATTRTVTNTVTQATTIAGTIPPREWGVCFSPRGGCANLIISWLARANRTIHIMIYSFTSDSISTALLQAKQRGVEIRIVLDDEQTKVQGGEYGRLLNAGLDVRVDKRAGFMHNKVAIIDGSVVLTGSYNWSSQAENTNRENYVIVKDSSLASKYEENFAKVWAAS